MPMRLSHIVLAIAISVAGATGPSLAQDTVPMARGSDPTRDTKRLRIARVLTIAHPAGSYRDPALQERSAYAQGSRVYLYIEVENLVPKFVTNVDKSRELHGSVVVDMVLRDATGKVVRSGKKIARTPIVKKIDNPSLVPAFEKGTLRLENIYLNLDFDPKLPAGAYTGAITVNDEACTACSATAQIRFSFTAP